MWRKYRGVLVAISAILMLVTVIGWSEAADSSAEQPPGPIQAKATTA